MAQQFQGGGITFDQGAGIRQNAQILQQSLAGLADQFNANKARFLEEYKAREAAFLAKAQEAYRTSGITLDAYEAGPGAAEYSQLIAARNNLGRIFGQGKEAQQGAIYDEMQRLNQNLSPAAQLYAAEAELMRRRGNPQDAVTSVYETRVTPGTPVAPAQAQDQATPETRIPPEDPGVSRANPAIRDKYFRLDTGSPTGVDRGFAVINPKTGLPLTTDQKPVSKDGSNIARFKDATLADQALASEAKGALEGDYGPLSLKQAYELQLIVPDYKPAVNAVKTPTAAEQRQFDEWVKTQPPIPRPPKSDAQYKQEVEASRVRGGIYANAPQTSTMADKQMAAKEAKAAETAPAVANVVEKVLVGTKISTEDVMRGAAAAKKLGNYFDNVAALDDKALKALVADGRKRINSMSPEELEAAGLTRIADRRDATRQLEYAGQIELKKAAMLAAAQEGKASADLVEQAVKVSDTLVKLYGQRAELMKAQGIKDPAKFADTNKDLTAQIKTLEKLQENLSGIKTPNFTVVKGFWPWSGYKFVEDTSAGVPGPYSNSSVEDAWAAMQ